MSKGGFREYASSYQTSKRSPEYTRYLDADVSGEYSVKRHMLK